MNRRTHITRQKNTGGRHAHAATGDETWFEHRSCRDKHRFASKKAAKRRGRPKGTHYKAYRCRFCGGYHLATKRKGHMNPDPILSTVTGCGRCGGDHPDPLAFAPLDRPVDLDDGSDAFTHWAPCPTNGQPILLRVVEED